MKELTTLVADLRELLSDELGFIWSDSFFYDALKESQREYLRRTRSFRVFTEVEPMNADGLINLPKDTTNIEYVHNSDYVRTEQVDYYSALRSEAGLLDTEFGTPLAIYNSKGENNGIRSYPNCKGTLDIYEWSEDFGLTLSIEDFEIDGGDWGIVGNDFGIINVFRNFDGEKLMLNASVNPESDFILIRFPDALIWRAASEILLNRTETEDFGRSDMFQKVFNKYVLDDIRLLKNRIGLKAQGEFY
jgi:hypothetical protein